MIIRRMKLTSLRDKAPQCGEQTSATVFCQEYSTDGDRGHTEKGEGAPRVVRPYDLAVAHVRRQLSAIGRLRRRRLERMCDKKNEKVGCLYLTSSHLVHDLPIEVIQFGSDRRGDVATLAICRERSAGSERCCETGEINSYQRRVQSHRVRLSSRGDVRLRSLLIQIPNPGNFSSMRGNHRNYNFPFLFLLRRAVWLDLRCYFLVDRCFVGISFEF